MSNVIQFPVPQNKYRLLANDKLELLEEFVRWQDRLKNYKNLSLRDKLEAIALLEAVKESAETQELVNLMTKHIGEIRKTLQDAV